MTVTDRHLCPLIQKIRHFYLQAIDHTAIFAPPPFKAGIFQSCIKVCRTSCIFIHLLTIRPISRIEFPRLGGKGRVHITAIIQEMTQPVILPTIFLDGILHTRRWRQMVLIGNDPLCPFDNPLQDAGPAFSTR